MAFFYAPINFITSFILNNMINTVLVHKALALYAKTQIMTY
ncbi:hypothetical protein PCARR_a0648 [Pseudoalteromonas carrageenovora IAM 12662]|uniref:Uncharacterized protein n=1 Tax=Pseudoalteromonas carrageenovora IAM 12662 TaxID=1314868 RepID=A0ABR9EP61_PSEVC|nr:hypothetical protein [Pseudoalteromonas carrageenovora IAM 12662]